MSFFTKSKPSTPFVCFNILKYLGQTLTYVKIRKRMELFLPFEALQYRFVKLPPLLCVLYHVILRENVYFLQLLYLKKRRRQPIHFILDSLSTPMNVPYTKFSENSMENLNHNAPSNLNKNTPAEVLFVVFPF